MVFRITRREFLRIAGFGGAAVATGFSLPSCASFPKDVDWTKVSDSEFSLEKFDGWFKAHKLNNGVNPNLKQKNRTIHSSFTSQLRNWYTPGIGYRSNNMYAVAPGIVVEWGEIVGTGRKGGSYLNIMHPSEGHEFRPTFLSTYAHIGDPVVRPGDIVKRNQLVAYVPHEFSEFAKLIFRRGGNHIDPDNYGENHGYMNYWDGKTDLDIADTIERDRNQKKILNNISEHLSDETKRDYRTLRGREHRAIFEKKVCFWDAVEIMRYYNELYKARPQLFLKLSKEHFEELKSSFYANQPIILTLPV